MASERDDRRRETFAENVLHPWSNLRKIQGLDRLPDRRVSRPKHHPTENDPLRVAGQAHAIYKALGLFGNTESRIQLYEDYREMDFDAIISAVLDSFGEDAAQIDAETGRVVSVTARNSDIAKIVLRCLERTHQEQRAFPTMRQTSRDGDVFEHVAAARGEGVIALKAYEPWQVARIEDDIGRLVGFSPADDRGCPAREEHHSVPYYKVVHYRLPGRNLTDVYGAAASFLWGSRVTWRELQLMLDQVVMQRLLRRPDRVSIIVDTTGMSHDDAHYYLEDLKRRMHREWNLNTEGGIGGPQFQSTGLPNDMGNDFVLSAGPGNNTKLENFPATNQNDLLRDVEMQFRQLANGIGFPQGYMGIGEGKYNPEQSLSRQHQPFAKRASRLQRAYLHETVRLCMLDMAYLGLDPTKEEHHFTLHMAPVSPILEMERHEVLQMKLDRLERALRLGLDNQFDQGFWVPFVLRTYGGFPDEVVAAMYPGVSGAKGADTEVGSADFPNAFTEHRNGNGKKGATPPDRKTLEESLVKVLGGDPADPKLKPEMSTAMVLGESMIEPERLASTMRLDEWVGSDKSKRSVAVASGLEDTLKAETRITPLNDDEARKARTKIAESRSLVARHLVLSGRVFDL